MPNEKTNPLIGVIGGFPEQLFVIVRWMIAAQLWKQALGAMLLAPLVGFLAFDLQLFPAAATNLNQFTVRFGGIFLTFINLLVPPVVAFSVFVGIVSNTDLGSVRRVGLTAIATYACTTIFAVTLGALLAKGLMPFAVSLIDPRLIEVTLASAGDIPSSSGTPSLLSILGELVPRGNLLAPFLEGNLLQIISIAVAAGVGTLAIMNMTDGSMVTTGGPNCRVWNGTVSAIAIVDHGARATRDIRFHVRRNRETTERPGHVRDYWLCPRNFPRFGSVDGCLRNWYQDHSPDDDIRNRSSCPCATVDHVFNSEFIRGNALYHEGRRGWFWCRS